MSQHSSKRTSVSVAAWWCLLVTLPLATPLHARITQIVIDETVSPAFCKGSTCASFGMAGQYEQLAGRAYGELDPQDPLNSIIQDINLGKDKDGKVRYVTSFVITKPDDMSKASGMLWHDVPNRGRPVLLAPMERAFGDVGLASGWQGDNAGDSGVAYRWHALDPVGFTNSLQVAIEHQRHDHIGIDARRRDGDVEPLDACTNVDDDGGDLGATVRLAPAVHENPHRLIVFSDAVDALVGLELGAEGDLDKPVDDLGLGEGGALGFAACGCFFGGAGRDGAVGQCVNAQHGGR